jgi:hypothetical protein
VDHVGYPGPSGSVHVSICTSYVDAAGAETIASSELVRLVARHEFGHVLGFGDAAAPNSDVDFMARGIHAGALAPYTFNELDIAMLTEAYGRKPAGALVDGQGDCLALVNGGLAFATCDGSAAQMFTFARGELIQGATGQCVTAAASELATATSCSVPLDAADQAWEPLQVQIRGFGGDCLQIDAAGDGEGGAGPGLAVNDCPDLRTGGAVWTVDYVDGGTRIRFHTPSNDCLTVDPSTLVVSLEACDGCAESDSACPTPDRFEVNGAGQIRFGAECLSGPALGSGHAETPDHGPASLAPCSLAPSMLWNLSGRIESPAGTALSYPLSVGTSAFGARTVNQGAFESQIFDFYFSDSTP